MPRDAPCTMATEAGGGAAADESALAGDDSDDIAILAVAIAALSVFARIVPGKRGRGGGLMAPPPQHHMVGLQ